MKSRRAFVMMDMIVGFALLAMIGSLLAVGLSKMHRTSDRLAEDRALWRSAESAMLDLQTGKSIDTSQVTLKRMTADAPAGKAWVELVVARDGRRAELIGLVPQSAASGRTSP
jgi:hypothetical protein